MKKHFIIMLLLFIAGKYSIAQYQYQYQYQYHISGIVPALNNKFVYLDIHDNYSNKHYEIKDSTLIKNNSFYFKGVIDKPCESAFIHTKDFKNTFYFIVDSGRNTIINKTESKNGKGAFSKMFVQGSQTNELCDKLSDIQSVFQKKYNISHSKDSIRLPLIKRKELANIQLKIIADNPSNFYGLIFLYNLSYHVSIVHPESVIRLIDELDTSIRFSSLGQELEKSLKNTISLEPGKKIPMLTANGINGPFSNTDLTGRPYLLAFGAPWCSPCKKNIPILQEAYQKNQSKGFTIMYVTLDETDTVKWRKFISDFHTSNWINISDFKRWDDSKIAQLFNIHMVPFYVLIDKDGIIKYNSQQQGNDIKQLLNIINTL